LDLLECVAEPARLNRSTRGVGFRIKKQNHVCTAKVLERYRLTRFIGEREVRGFIINFHGFFVFERAMTLYRRSLLHTSFTLLLLTLVVAGADAQRRKPHKLRATGLLELTTDQGGTVTARVVPITILDQGRFYDASIYESRPRPMAIEDGVVYEAQKSGLPIGYITIANGSRNKGNWVALGKWQAASPASEEAKKSAPPAPSVASADDRPRLHRGESSSSAAPSSTPTPAPVAQSTPEPEVESQDPNRPVLRRRAPRSTEPEASSTSVPASPTPAPQPSAAAKTVLVSKPGTQAFVAVSDAQSSDTRSFQYIWKPGEEEKAAAKMRKLALAQLPQENARLGDGSLTNVAIRSFDLDLSNDAVMVLSAEVPGSYVAPGQKSTPGKFVSRYITLIARVDDEGNPQRLAVSVTDSSRLDVAPRLELIDAVDADGDGLGELLFREYSFDEKSFIIYGIGRGTVTKVFEGASSPLP
jgi:hypothetical protein